MAFTQISSTNIANGAILPVQVSSSFEAEYAKSADLANYATASEFSEVANNVPPKISTVEYANSAYYVIDDTAANTSNSNYVIVSGSGFVSGAQIIVESTSALSTTYVSPTVLHANIPAKNAGTYNVFVVNPDGGTAIKVNGVTYSNTAVWVTSATLSDQLSNIAFTGTLSATGAVSYNVASGSSLPPGFNLVSANGYYYANVSVGSETTYNFTINAVDAENQDTPRTFTQIIRTSNAPTTVEYLILGGGGSGGNNPQYPASYAGAGGGAGGLLYGNTAVERSTTYTLTVGGGGASYPSGVNGTNSTGFGLTAYGGGKGAMKSDYAAGNGGSGGGAAETTTSGKGVYPGSSYISAARQGYDGGSSPNYSTGGGGAGEAGYPGTTPSGATGSFPYYHNRQTGVAGGNGLSDASLNGMLSNANIGETVGPSRFIGGGGGGGAGTYGGAGGAGGGGFGGNGYESAPQNPSYRAKANMGGGGGGMSYSVSGYDSSGSSGVIVIRYPEAKDNAASTTGSPTFTINGGYKIYTFTGTGTISWN